MNERDEQILNHIGRYTVSIRAVVERLFFAGKDSDHVINRLLTEERIQAIPLPQNLSAYQLTLSEARQRGMEHRGRPNTTVNTLPIHLATLWFCCMAGHTRKRLSEREVKEAFEIPGPQRLTTPHVIHSDEEETTVYRMFFPEGGVRRFADGLVTECFKVGQDDQILSQWAARGTYQFAILSDTELRDELLQKELLPKQTDLPVKLHFETVPPYDRLADAIRSLKELAINA
jgi:hypothetical protein